MATHDFLPLGFPSPNRCGWMDVPQLIFWWSSLGFAMRFIFAPLFLKVGRKVPIFRKGSEMQRVGCVKTGGKTRRWHDAQGVDRNRGPSSFKKTLLVGSLLFCSRFEPRRVKKVNHQPSNSGLGCVTIWKNVWFFSLLSVPSTRPK